jgi:hypothetical protein
MGVAGASNMLAFKTLKMGLSPKEQIMLRLRKFTSFLTAFAIVTLVAMAGVAAGRDSRKQSQVEIPLNLAILIQDDLVSHVGNELDITRDFIQALPEGSRVMVGYIRSGSLQVRQRFTSDLGEAARALRVPVSSTSASPFNPYVEVLEGLRSFESEKNPNALLLISDGLDTSRGFDAASVLHSIDLERSIEEAKRRKVTIYSFYAPSVGLTRRSHLAASYGQSSLNRLSNETGGKAFFEGTNDFVTFNSHFERLVEALNQRYSEY